MNRPLLRASVVKDINIMKRFHLLVIILSTAAMVLYSGLRIFHYQTIDKEIIIYLEILLTSPYILAFGALAGHTLLNIESMKTQNRIWMYLGVQVLTGIFLLGELMILFSNQLILVWIVHVLGWGVIRKLSGFK